MAGKITSRTRRNSIIPTIPLKTNTKCRKMRRVVNQEIIATITPQREMPEILVSIYFVSEVISTYKDDSPKTMSGDDDIAAEYREEDEQEVDLIDRNEEPDPIIDIGPHIEQTDPDQGDNESGDNNRINKSPQPAEQSSLDTIINITSDIAQTGVSAVAVTPNKSRDDGLTEDAQLHPNASSAEVGKDILANDQVIVQK